jgi:hypothetical protein
VCPTELPLPDDIFQIRRQAVAPENAGERLAEDGLQHVGAAGGDNAHERVGDEGPEPAFLLVGAMAGLVGIEHRFVGQRRGEFGTGRRNGRARFFPGLLRAAQADRDLELSVNAL